MLLLKTYGITYTLYVDLKKFILSLVKYYQQHRYNSLLTFRPFQDIYIQTIPHQKCLKKKKKNKTVCVFVVITSYFVSSLIIAKIKRGDMNLFELYHYVFITSKHKLLFSKRNNLFQKGDFFFFFFPLSGILAV